MNRVLSLPQGGQFDSLLFALLLAFLALGQESRLTHAAAISFVQNVAEPSPQSADHKTGPRITGSKIYQNQCAICHGTHGEGTTDYPSPLIGDLPVDELTRYIDKTMPEDDPEKCVGEDARLVAHYIHSEFYSPQAQQKRQKAKVDFSRLTARQFKESIVDILGNFDHSPWHPPERGLKADYFAARNWTDERRLSEQVDLQIDFAEGVPHFNAKGEYPAMPPKKKDENQMNEGFSAFWHGAVLAPESGQYIFKVESRNGFVLTINHGKPLLDRRVRSDEGIEHEGKIYLHAGRAYSLKLDFFSYPDPPARIRLLWKTPHGVDEVIPAEYLMPTGIPPAAVVATSFPPDDSSSGYERGISISQEWDEAVTSSSMETANWVSDHLFEMAKTKIDDADRIEKIRKFCREFVEFAFVTKLNEQEVQFFVNQHFENDLALRDQVFRIVVLAIKSPRFLYPELQMRDRNFLIARRMALVLWDSVPDRKLFELAEQGKLTDEDVANAEIHRMLSDPRARAKLLTFFDAWLDVDRGFDAPKDPKRFPEFDPRQHISARRSLTRFVDDVAWRKEGDYRQLFTTNKMFVDQRMADFHGWQLPPGEPANSNDSQQENEKNRAIKKERADSAFREIAVDPEKFAGLLTHPYLMASHAYYQESSPIHRGVFVARKLMGRTLKQPNENFKPLAEDFDPTMTNRQRVEFQTKDENCMSCHSIINPLGFSLENFDAVGRFRDSEKEKKIEASTTYKTSDGREIQIGKPGDLARFLVEDELAQKNFVRQVFQHYVRQPIQAFGNNALDETHQKFVQDNFNIPQLLNQITRRAVSDFKN